MMEAARLWQHCLDEDYVAASADLARLRRTYGIDGLHVLWARQVLDIEQRCKAQLAAAGG